MSQHVETGPKIDLNVHNNKEKRMDVMIKDEQIYNKFELSLEPYWKVSW